MIPSNSLQKWKCSPWPCLETHTRCGSDTSALFCCLHSHPTTTKNAFKFFLFTSLFQHGQQLPRWEEKGRFGFFWVGFFSLFCFYIKRGRAVCERLSVTADAEVFEASRDTWEMKQEILRAPVLTLSLCVRAATPLAWIMAMKMGMSPKGLPFPPAMLIPRASFGPWNRAKPNICSRANWQSSGYGNNDCFDWWNRQKMGLTHTSPHPKHRHTSSTRVQTQIKQLDL